MRHDPSDKNQVKKGPYKKEGDGNKQERELLCNQRDLAITLSATSDLHKGLSILLETALRNDAVDCGAVYLVNDISGCLELTAHKGLSQQFVDGVIQFRADSFQAGRVMEGMPYYGLHTDMADNIDRSCLREGLQSVAIIPVQHEGRVVSALNLASHTHKKIPLNTRIALEVIAAQSGAFIARVKADEKLRESEEKYRKSFENDSDAVMIFDTETLQFEDANRATLNLYGYSKDEFLARTVEDISNEKEKTRAAVRKVLENNPDFTRIPIRYFRKKDGTVFPGEISTATFMSNGRKKIIGAVRDITDRKRAEDKIHSLTHELIKAQETERLKIARYLHDQIAQDLSTLKIRCETLFDSQPPASQKIKQKVSEMSDILQESITAVRDLSYDLRPPGMDHLGLAPTIFQYCEEFSNSQDLNLDFHAAGIDELRLDYDIEINLYRLVQEALNNVRQHAQASSVTVRLVASYPNIILRIEDNGLGFDVEGRVIRAASEKRMGLDSMKERAGLLNGNLKIQSRLGEGTKIIIEVPIREHKIGSKKKYRNRR
jgi:PAS domain S-box-containing protein